MWARAAICHLGEDGQAWWRTEGHRYTTTEQAVNLQCVTLKEQPSHLQARHGHSKKGWALSPVCPWALESAAGQRTQGQQVQLTH